jgi:hypothetical protein
MSGGYISFFNASTRFSDAQLQNAIPDFQSQVSGEFNWFWGLNAYLDENGYGTPVIIVDYPGANDPQGALGYHWIDGNFQPYAVIFAGLCEDYGYPVTGVISHELLEIMADQLADTTDLYDNGDGTGFIVLQEVCDPVEQNLYYEGPNGNIVSDFALPDWYAPGSPGPFDFLGAVQGAWQLASGGYVSYQFVQLSGWQQASADKLAKVAENFRTKVTSSGNPRMDVIRQMQAQRGPGVGQRQPATIGQGRQQTNGRSQQGTAQRRQQTAQQASGISVVSRQDVPNIPGQHEQQLSRQPVRSGGPRAQTVPGLASAGAPR